MDLANVTRFLWENARHLERAILAHRLLGEPPDGALRILRTYQNEDGGLGHALEPDLRAPESQPLFVEFGLRTLHTFGLHDRGLAQRAAAFVEGHADLERGIPTLLPSAQRYPRAGHWHHAGSYEPSMHRLVGLVGLLHAQGARNAWMDRAVEASLAHIAETPYDEAHAIVTAFALLESVGSEQPVDRLVDKLAAELPTASSYVAETPVTGYGLTPLHFAPGPNAFCRRIFSDDLIEAHLDDLMAQQEDDGGWPIRWEPPGEAARWEWRARWTLEALVTLRAYGRV